MAEIFINGEKFDGEIKEITITPILESITDEEISEINEYLFLQPDEIKLEFETELNKEGKEMVEELFYSLPLKP